MKTIALLAGDGIGPEIMAEAMKVLDALRLSHLSVESALVGGAAYRSEGHPLPDATLALTRRADAILFGAVGDPECDDLPHELRPEQAVLGLRKELELFANLRPAKAFASLAGQSPLRRDIAESIDLMIVRELTGDVYFGEKGQRQTDMGLREGYDLMSYDEEQVARIAHVAFRAAQGRSGRLCSVDKANVLQTSVLWREIVTEVAADYPRVALSHMYVDNAAMQLARDPGQFDVIVTGNMFGDILSDLASMCVGSIGLLASASQGSGSQGLYEPIHGSAPDIAGQGFANPVAMILSLAELLRHSLSDTVNAERIERAVASVIEHGPRTRDLGGTASTDEVGDAVVAALQHQEDSR